MKTYNYYIGIDPGVQTGTAIWIKKEKTFLSLATDSIHVAFETIKSINENFKESGVFIRVEDARQRSWYGENSNAKLQGAGSVKRDCKIWEDFLTDIKADFEMVAPKKGMTKHNAETFRRMTGYIGKTSSHSRDAAILVFGF